MRFVFSFFLLLAFSCSNIVLAQTPNVLLVIIDDVANGPIPTFEPTGANQTKAEMPHLEELISNGLSFENYWVSPTCSPTRASMLTGKHGYKTGVLDPSTSSNFSDNEYSLFQAIKDQSDTEYSTALIGKWHLGTSGPGANLDGPYTFGMDYFAGLLGGAVTDYNDWRLIENGSNTTITEYATTKFTDLAIDWINQQNNPWFCWMAYTGAHSPYHLPPLEMHTQGELPTDSASIAENPMPYYIAMVESIDFELGRIKNSVSAETWANTVVIFMGDNGTPGNLVLPPYSSNRGKGSIYQGGVNVPLIIAGPGIERINERETALVSGTDMFSTVLSLCGGSDEAYEDSRSMLPLFQEAGNSIRDCAYIDAGPPNANAGNPTVGWAIRDAQYKLLLHQNNSNQLFYDLLADPYEQMNLLNAELNTDQEEAYNALMNKKLDLSVGIDDLSNKTSILPYPNPMGDILIVELPFEESQHFSLVNLQGNIVSQGVLQHGENQLSFGSLPSGIYLLSINGMTTKVVKR